MKSKIIIYSLIIFLFASFLYLAYVEQKQQDPNYQKNWWALYFEDPKSDSLNFVIENHGDSSNFHWEASNDKGKFNEGDIDIKKGGKENIDISGLNNGKTAIQVTSGGEKKEIYKNL